MPYAAKPKMANPIHRKLEEIYDEMRSRQLSAIRKAGTMRPDPFFAAPPSSSSTTVEDSRRCLAISSVIDEHTNCRWSAKYDELQRRLAEEFGHSGLRYDQKGVGGRANDGADAAAATAMAADGQLHWTVMQLVGFADYEQEIPASNGNEEAQCCTYATRDYLDCIQDTLMVGGMDHGVRIEYIGVIVVATGLLMVGVPSMDVNDARDALRAKLSDRNLPLHEPFVNDIVHSTLFRVSGKPEEMDANLHQRLMDIASEFKSVHLGTVTLKNFQVGPASWRMLREEVESTPPFRKWTLSGRTPREEFEGNITTAEGDVLSTSSCFTVSGASGANLAKEIKAALWRQSSDVESNKNSTPKRPDGKLSRQASNADSDASASQRMQAELEDNLQQETTGDINCSFEISSQSNEEADGADPSYNAATISGAGGMALAQELQRRLQEENRMLTVSYNTDFY